MKAIVEGMNFKYTSRRLSSELRAMGLLQKQTKGATEEQVRKAFHHTTITLHAPPLDLFDCADPFSLLLPHNLLQITQLKSAFERCQQSSMYLEEIEKELGGALNQAQIKRLLKKLGLKKPAITRLADTSDEDDSDDNAFGAGAGASDRLRNWDSESNSSSSSSCGSDSSSGESESEDEEEDAEEDAGTIQKMNNLPEEDEVEVEDAKRLTPSQRAKKKLQVLSKRQLKSSQNEPEGSGKDPHGNVVTPGKKKRRRIQRKSSSNPMSTPKAIAFDDDEVLPDPHSPGDGEYGEDLEEPAAESQRPKQMVFMSDSEDL